LRIWLVVEQWFHHAKQVYQTISLTSGTSFAVSLHRIDYRDHVRLFLFRQGKDPSSDFVNVAQVLRFAF